MKVNCARTYVALERLIVTEHGIPYQARASGGRSHRSIAPMWHRSLCLGKRHHWSNVIKAASYLHPCECRDTFIRKERGDKSMM